MVKEKDLELIPPAEYKTSSSKLYLAQNEQGQFKRVEILKIKFKLKAEKTNENLKSIKVSFILHLLNYLNLIFCLGLVCG